MKVILEYKGKVAFETIEHLLAKLKNMPAYRAIQNPDRKRIYSIFVECIENINKHTISEAIPVNDCNREPYIRLTKQEAEFVISSGNIIMNEGIDRLKNRLEQINQLDEVGLKTSYTDIIDREFVSEEDGSGLGLITIGLKAKNKIQYHFVSLNDQCSFFEMKVSV